MKKLLLIPVLLFQITITLAQTIQTTNGGKGYSGTAGAMEKKPQNIPKTSSSTQGKTGNGQTNNNTADSNKSGIETVSDWMPASPCFPELYYQVLTRYPGHLRNYRHDGSFSVWTKFKNTSSKPIKFWVKINVQNSLSDEKDLSFALGTGTINPNGISETETYTSAPPQTVAVNIYKGTYAINTTNYIDCVNGVLNNNSKAQTNNSNTGNTQINSVDNSSKEDLERQTNEKNAEAQRQQQVLKQQQEAQRQQAKMDAINAAGSVVSNTAMSITNAGLANLVRQTEIENEVKNILNGRESLYPDATKYFDVYLKEKRKRKTGNWIGIGVMIGGTVAAGAGALSGGEYDINYPLVYGGIGAVVVGLFKTITTLSVGKKGNEALQNAKKSLTLGTASSGLGMSIKF